MEHFWPRLNHELYTTIAYSLVRLRALLAQREWETKRDSYDHRRNFYVARFAIFLHMQTDLIWSDLIFSRPRSEGWPHHGRTFSIYPCPLSFWLTLPRRVLFATWCCPSRPRVAFLAFVHLALFLALSLSPGNSLVSSLCDHSMLASLLWRCLTVSSLLRLC